jgi:hypothetical protein
LVKLWSEKLIKMFIIILVSVWLSSEAFYYPPVVRSELYNSILNSLEQKEISCFLFCDFSKAFDKVWLRGLIHKMNYYGIKGPLIKWFENYLYQRKQKVINRATSSTVCEVSAGVPQGSVLGPLLFLTYILERSFSLLVDSLQMILL